MKFISAILFNFLIIGSSAAQQLLPFDQWQSRNPKWQADLSEISYVGARCSALLGMVGRYFLENPGKPEDLDTGKGLMERSKTFLDVSSLIGIRLGMDADGITGRYSALLETYSKNIIKNRQLHNNLFEEPIFSDLKFCSGIEKLYVALSKKSF